MLKQISQQHCWMAKLYITRCTNWIKLVTNVRDQPLNLKAPLSLVTHKIDCHQNFTTDIPLYIWYSCTQISIHLLHSYNSCWSQYICCNNISNISRQSLKKCWNMLYRQASQYQMSQKCSLTSMQSPLYI